VGVDSAWEQKKLEASVSTSSTTKKCLKMAQHPACPVHIILAFAQDALLGVFLFNTNKIFQGTIIITLKQLDVVIFDS